MLLVGTQKGLFRVAEDATAKRWVIDGPGEDGNWSEYKAEYGRTLICGHARLGGYAVGIVANQKTHQKEKGRRFEVGGVIYEEAADKAARFVMNCAQNKIPLLLNKVYPCHEVVKIDYHLQGCPPPADTIWAALTALLTDKPVELPYELIKYD